MRRIGMVLLAAALLVCLCPPAARADDRLVLAFYYTWFDENSCGANKVPDRPAEPYISRDRGVMGRHI